MLFSLCYVLGVLADGRARNAILRPAAESAISAVRRFRFVSSFLALTTHRMAALRYKADVAWKQYHAAWLARNAARRLRPLLRRPSHTNPWLILHQSELQRL